MAALPGEGPFYHNMYDVIRKAGEEMAPGEVLAMDNFTLLDAMNAIQVMDPRMDSGCREADGSSTNETPRPFNVNTRLLPDEVCWILDRTFAAEMAWHQGITLTQSIYTVLYVHHMGNFASWSTSSAEERGKPLPLINLVLASGILAMLKSCSIAWREFSRGCVYEHEDWQAEKAGVSLAEHAPAADVVALLERAIQWLRTQNGFESSSMERLTIRLDLRRHWILLLSLELPADIGSLPFYLSKMRFLLDTISGGPDLHLSTNSPARAAVDPAVKSRITSVMPLKSLELPDSKETWELVYGWLTGMEDFHAMCTSENPLSWQTFLSIRSYSPPTARRSGFIRSMTSYAIFDGTKLLGRHDRSWITETVLRELAGIPSGKIIPEMINGVPTLKLSSNLHDELEHMTDLLLSFFTTLCHNRPRQRRILANAVPLWRTLLLSITDVVTRFGEAHPDRHMEKGALQRLILIVDYYRCRIAVEVIFSGFELELYSRSEWVLVLCYANAVLGRQGEVLRVLRRALSEPSVIQSEDCTSQMEAEIDFNEGLRNLVMGALLGLVTDASVTFGQSEERLLRNMERRFKWASAVDDPEEDGLQPDWPANIAWIRDQASVDARELREEAVGWCRAAGAAFRSLAEHLHDEGCYRLCWEEYRDFTIKLVAAADRSASFWSETLANSLELPSDRLVIQWGREEHPWFITPKP